MNVTKNLILLLMCYTDCGCAADIEKKYPAYPPSQYQTVSIISLIANPSTYDQTKVRVSGYMEFIGEHNTIYYSKESSWLGNSAEGIAVEFGKSKYSGLSWSEVKLRYDNVYGYILGTFYSNHALNAGFLTDIEEISTISTEQFEK